jgi:hypothetical protein
VTRLLAVAVPRQRPVFLAPVLVCVLAGKPERCRAVCVVHRPAAAATVRVRGHAFRRSAGSWGGVVSRGGGAKCAHLMPVCVEACSVGSFLRALADVAFLLLCSCLGPALCSKCLRRPAPATPAVGMGAELAAEARLTPAPLPVTRLAAQSPPPERARWLWLRHRLRSQPVCRLWPGHRQQGARLLPLWVLRRGTRGSLFST